MRAESRFSFRLFAAIAAIALAFVASSIYANWRLAEIEDETAALLTNALPSVERLTAAIDAIHDVEAAVDGYFDEATAQRSSARVEIQHGWAKVDAELTAYLELPAFPGERDLYTPVPASLRDVVGSIEHVLAEVDAGQVGRARVAADSELNMNANRSARLLRQLVRLNAKQAAESADRIAKTRGRVTNISAALNGMTVLFTLVMVFWLWRVFRAYSTLQDVHARLLGRRAEELELFGRRVAHDLLSPLSSLTFCLSAFKRVSEGNPKLESALVRARECVVRAQTLVDNVFDFARSGGVPNKEVRTEIKGVLEEVAEEARAVDPGERAELTIGEVSECAVACSRGVLLSILGNLVRNSIKFMRDSAVKRIAIRVSENTRNVRFEVEDTGPGIPPGLEEKIWEPYVRAEGVTQPGLGLGLATVKRFCEAHGGSVGVRSVSGRGSLFYFTLPKAAEGDADSLPPASTKLLHGSA
jgi:signal transduction histidine kinase